METNTRGATGTKAAVTVATAAVAFVCGWSAGGWAQGLGLAVALGAAAGIAAFSERPGRHSACAHWPHRHRHDSKG